MPATILCIGDLHLGRRPGGIPGDLPGIRPEDLRPEVAWRAAVARAREGVDAVLLAGDVVESLEDRFAAFGTLESGVRRLVEAGVAVFAVAGNHDVVALPRLAERIEGFRLLGRGGRWEETAVPNRAGIPIRLWGWSFPRAHCDENPLDSLALRAPPDAVVLGLLHADLDQTASRYAPVRRADLEAAGAGAWLLGHIHRPGDLASGPRPIGYLGSLSPLDAGEPGPHGAWLARIEGPSAVRMQMIPLAPLRYERVEVDLASLDEDPGGGAVADRLFDRIHAAMRARSDAIGGGLDAVRLVACRVTLTGRCREHREIAAIARDRSLEGRDFEIGDRRWIVEKIEDHAAPAIDLEPLARGSDPPAILARRLLAIERGDPAAADLRRRARRRLDGETRKTRWAPVAGDGEAATDEAAWLRRAGMRLLEELLAQRPGTDGPAR